MSRFNFEFIIEKEFKNSYVEIFINVKNYIPTRPAPICSNPSSPAFSDCGDDPEFEDYTANILILTEQGQIFFVPLPDDLHDVLETEIIDEIFKRGDKHYWIL